MQLFISLSSSRKKQEYVIKQEIDMPRYKQYMRSLPELKKELKSEGFKKVTLEGMIELFGKSNKALADNTIIELSMEELYTIREYDRDVFSDGWNGRKSEEEYKEHEKHIALNGIKEFGVVTLRRKKPGVVTAQLTEGNHRLAIGRKQRIRTMPIMIFYSEY